MSVRSRNSQSKLKPGNFRRSALPLGRGAARAGHDRQSKIPLASERSDFLSSEFWQMIQRDYLIIGTGIAGVSACEGIRKHDKRGSVTLVGAEIYHPYKRWILSKNFLREKTPQIKKLACFDEHWYDS